MSRKQGNADELCLLRRLAGRGPEGGRKVGAADRAVLDRLIARDLARPEGDGAVLTDAGRAFLRRRLSGADGFAAQHQERGSAIVDHSELGQTRVRVNHGESPLSRLRRLHGRDRRPLIDAAEFAAGERLRADYTRGQMMPRVTANWDAAIASHRRHGGPGDAATATDAAVSVRRRVQDALSAVGPEFAGLLVDVCCFLKGLDEVERERQWPARSAKVVLRLGLARLARHYGLAETAEASERSRRSRHWGSEDYRPEIEPSVD